ncbi:PAS domain-containing protein [candidate division KSB1 bacterium]|nr:PAS domain-containing protein [candidate division KSB1 bacterium]
MRLSDLFDGLVAAGLAVFIGCGQSLQSKSQPLASKGVLDLSNWDFKQDGPVDLSGEYEFYWQQLLTPASFSPTQLPEKSGFIKVPGYWTGYQLNGTKLPGTGYATYRLTVLLKDSIAAKLAFKFLDMGTACTVFANGERILSMGTAGSTRETTVPRYFPQVVDFAPNARRIELIFQVSNFHHTRGGAWEAIRLGTKEQINKIRERRLALDLILFGSILIMGLYHLTLFRLRKNEWSLFFFGVFCLLIAIRLLTTVERYLLHVFPAMSWELFVKVEYLSIYLAGPVFALFLYRLFSHDFHKPVIAAILAIGLLFSGIVALAPARIFTQTLHAYELFIVTSVIYALSMLVLCTVRQRDGAAIILLGFLFLTATIVNDILDVDVVIQTGHFMHVGLFIFIFSHAYLLSSQYARAFTTIDLQRGELEKSNIQYQQEARERRQAEAALRDSEERFRQLAENIREVFWLSNPEKSRIFYISPGYEAIWGRTCESLYASPQNWLQAIHPADRDRVFEAALTKQISGEYDETYRIRQPDGAIRWIRDRAFPVRDKAGAIYRIAGIAEDITERKQALENLEASSERLRALSAHLQFLREQERLAIARDMHDELGQVLTSLMMDLTVLERRSETAGEALTPAFYLQEIKRMKEVIEATIDRITQLITKLRPQVLDSLGLLEALEWQIQEFRRHAGLEYEFISEVDEIELAAEPAVAVFRIFQESLTNIARHAHASKVVVEIKAHDDNICLEIRDNGAGISAAALEKHDAFGLLGMKERALVFGGEVEIAGTPGQGTTVKVRIPTTRGDEP